MTNFPLRLENKWAQWGVVSGEQFFLGPGGIQTVEIWSRSGVSRNHGWWAARPATEKHEKYGAAKLVTNMLHGVWECLRCQGVGDIA